jgi:hypothetical protein
MLRLERIVIEGPPGGILTFFKNNDLYPLSTFDFKVREVIIIVPTVWKFLVYTFFLVVFKDCILIYWTVLKEYIQCTLEPQFGIMLCL